MECIRCGTYGELNRVVVNQLTGRERGLLCEDCEAETFGRLLENPAWHQEHGCAFCDGDGRFVLPELDCLIEYDDADAPPLVEYGDAAEAVRFCEAHLEELLPDEQSLTARVEA